MSTVAKWLLAFGTAALVGVWWARMTPRTANFTTVLGILALAGAVFLSSGGQPIFVRFLWSGALACGLGLVAYYTPMWARSSVTYFDESDKRIQAPSDVVVEYHDVLDDDRAFIRGRVSQSYLSTGFRSRRTLSYGNRRYQPFLLTFQSDPARGPGMIVGSPEKGNAEVWLDEQIRVEGFGAREFTSDMTFKLYVWQECVCFMPLIKVRYSSGQRFQFGPTNKHLATFTSDARMVGCSAKIAEAESFFAEREPA